MQLQSLFIKSQWTQLVKRISAITLLGLTIAAPAWAIEPNCERTSYWFSKKLD